MTTASQIITRSANALGYLGITEVLSAADANQGLNVFNAMLDSWNGEGLNSYAWSTLNFTLVPNTQSYTIGPTGVWVATRPTQIYDAWLTDSNNLQYPLGSLPQDRWNNIGDKTITSQIPTSYFYDSQYPNGIINIFPIPLLGYAVSFNVQLQQVDFSNLVTTLSMPPGYERAFVLNLALEMMAQGYPCVLDQNQLARLTENASQAKANIKRANIKEVISDYDAAIVSKSYATYNIYSDSNPRS
jgi:hypothetical protein